MDRCAHIQLLAPEHRVTMLGALLGVSRSAYYDWRGGPGPRQQEDCPPEPGSGGPVHREAPHLRSRPPDAHTAGSAATRAVSVAWAG